MEFKTWIIYLTDKLFHSSIDKNFFIVQKKQSLIAYVNFQWVFSMVLLANCDPIWTCIATVLATFLATFHVFSIYLLGAYI